MASLAAAVVLPWRAVPPSRRSTARARRPCCARSCPPAPRPAHRCGRRAGAHGAGGHRRLSARRCSRVGVDTTNLLTALSKFLASAVTPGVPAFVVFLGGLVVAGLADIVARTGSARRRCLGGGLLPPSGAGRARLAGHRALVQSIGRHPRRPRALEVRGGGRAVAGGRCGCGWAGVSNSGNSGQFASVVTGIALLLIAILAPFTLLRLVPAVEAGAVGHLESTRHRLKSGVATPINSGRNLARTLPSNRDRRRARTTPEQLAQPIRPGWCGRGRSCWDWCGGRFGRGHRLRGGGSFRRRNRFERGNRLRSRTWRLGDAWRSRRAPRLQPNTTGRRCAGRGWRSSPWFDEPEPRTVASRRREPRQKRP